MKKYLIIYSTHDGQTHKIAQFIASELQQETDLMDLNQAYDIDLSIYERVIIGASIRYGHFNKQLYAFIKKHAMVLEKGKACFYSVNLTARKPGKDTPEGSSYIQTFLKKSQWKPEQIGVFAGGLYYPRYVWFDRIMIRFIMSMTGGETDTTKEIEYTNWEKVAQFAQMIKRKG